MLLFLLFCLYICFHVFVFTLHYTTFHLTEALRFVELKY